MMFKKVDKSNFRADNENPLVQEFHEAVWQLNLAQQHFDCCEPEYQDLATLNINLQMSRVGHLKKEAAARGIEAHTIRPLLQANKLNNALGYLGEMRHE